MPKQLEDLIAQLDHADEALYDTFGLLNDGNPDSCAIVTMNNINVARAALDAAASYLYALRAQETDEVLRRPARRPATMGEGTP